MLCSLNALLANGESRGATPSAVFVLETTFPDSGADIGPITQDVYGHLHVTTGNDPSYFTQDADAAVRRLQLVERHRLALVIIVLVGMAIRPRHETMSETFDMLSWQAPV